MTVERVLPVVMAGGEGRRLRPLSAVIPKPLVPVGGVSILERILRSLEAVGFRRVVISTGYMAPLVRAVVQEFSSLSMDVRFVFEEVPLGTAGALVSAPLMSEVHEDDSGVLAINGDTLTDLDYSYFCRSFPTSDEVIRVATSEILTTSEFGQVQGSTEIFTSDPGSSEPGDDLKLLRVEGVSEKPTYHQVVSMGVNLFRTSFLRSVKLPLPLGVPDLIQHAIAESSLVTHLPHKGYWYDLGRFSDLANVEEQFDKERVPDSSVSRPDH